MATVVLLLLCSKLFFQVVPNVRAATHWVVTEDGRLQSQVDSIFQMRRPYDLVALMNQEKRGAMLDTLKQELMSKKEEIDKNEDKDTGLEQRFYKTDSDCLSAGKPLPEFDLYISTVLPLENKGIRPEEHIDFKAPPVTTPQAPYCTEVKHLDYSIHAFEHLEGMKDRSNLSGTPELGLKNAITHRDNVDDYGHLIYEALKKNTTSWVLYNMAAFYWRIKGDTYQVTECLRRALHFSPRLQKDVALISLANILHRARYSNEAAIVVHAALDVSKELNVNHFTLGNVYAVLAEYNKSVICFQNTLKIQPEFEAAAKRKHAVLCHAKLERALEDQHRSLQRTLKELRDYQSKHEQWVQQEEKLRSEQASPDVKMMQKHTYENWLKESSAGSGEYCHMTEKDGHQLLQCSWGRKHPVLTDKDFESRNEEPGGDFDKEISLPANGVYTKPVRPPKYTHRLTEEENAQAREREMPYLMKDWPSKEECDNFVQRFPSWNEFPTTFLSPESKGFEIKALLAEAQGLKRGTQHPLPWYPPVCTTLSDIPVSDKSYDHIEAVKERSKEVLKIPDSNMRETFLKLVDGKDMTEDEVGQRILTALKKNIGPSWILFNLAGFYWRVIGNKYQGIECLRRSLHAAPEEYKDVPLNNLANILYKWGRTDDAVTIMRDAVAVNSLEPETHFFLGNMLAAKGNMSGALHHYREALNQDFVYMEAYLQMRNVKCYQKFHRKQQSDVPKAVAQPVNNNCQKNVQSNKPVESTVICKNENNKDTCVIETKQTDGHCVNEQCKQTCTITPIKMEACANKQNGVVKCAGNVEVINNEHINVKPNDKCEKASNHPQYVPVSDTEGPGNPMDDPNFSERLDEVSKYYEEKGVCTGDECQKLIVQSTSHQKPHTRLEIINGILHQKLIFAESPSEITVSPTECLIFNDGSKSAGCAREEFKPFDLEEFTKIMSQTYDASIRESFNFEDAMAEKLEEMVKNHLSTSTSVQTEKSSPQNLPQPKVLDYSDHSIIQNKPDPIRHVRVTKLTPKPTLDFCKRNHKPVDFKEFTSTWISVASKGVDLTKFIDFKSDVSASFEEPICENDDSVISASAVLDGVPGVKNFQKLRYHPEQKLAKLVQEMGGKAEPLNVAATRIAKGLKNDRNSWILADLATLYWRAKGNSKRAVECIRLSYAKSPSKAKDIAILSLADIIHLGGRVRDAIILGNVALEFSPEVVAVHFSMANFYAATEDWQRAILFYESTLALQPKFSPAAERLQAILCQQVLGAARKSKK